MASPRRDRSTGTIAVAEEAYTRMWARGLDGAKRMKKLIVFSTFCCLQGVELRVDLTPAGMKGSPNA
jgi:hypothetical protein